MTGEKDPLRAAIERLADQYDNTNRDARFAPDAVAWRLRKILADNPVSPPGETR